MRALCKRNACHIYASALAFPAICRTRLRASFVLTSIGPSRGSEHLEVLGATEMGEVLGRCSEMNTKSTQSVASRCMARTASRCVARTASRFATGGEGVAHDARRNPKPEPRPVWGSLVLCTHRTSDPEMRRSDGRNAEVRCVHNTMELFGLGLIGACRARCFWIIWTTLGPHRCLSIIWTAIAALDAYCYYFGCLIAGFLGFRV